MRSRQTEATRRTQAPNDAGVGVSRDVSRNSSPEQLYARIAQRARGFAEEARTKAQRAKAAWKQARDAVREAKRAAKRARKAAKEAQASFKRAMMKKKMKKKRSARG